VRPSFDAEVTGLRSRPGAFFLFFHLSLSLTGMNLIMLGKPVAHHRGRADLVSDGTPLADDKSITGKSTPDTLPGTIVFLPATSF
ncbi:hypothetical protein ACJELT_005491, partial [Klebsiella pneumoniae]